MAEAGPSNQGHAALSRVLDAFDAAVTETTHHLVESWQSKPPLTDVDLTSQLIPQAQRLREDVYTLIGEEEAQRSTLRDLATSQLRLALSSIDVEATSLVYAHLDFATSCQEASLIDDGVPLTLIEELNERIPVDSIHDLFAYLESRVSWLTRNLSPSKGKGLVLLRLLNDMLRRLSKPSREHLVLSGRILALLASVFPLGERSGVNLRGDFNTANVTRIDEDDEQPVKRGADEDEDEDDKDADPASLAARDSTFYRAFWALQNAFSNPALLFEPAPEPEAPTTNDGDLAPPASTAEEKQHDDEGRSEETKDQSGSTDAANDGGNETAGASSPTISLSPFQIFRNTTSRVLDVFSDASAREKEMSQAERAASKGGRAAAKAAAATAAAADAPGAAEESLISAKKRKRDEMLQHNAAGSLLGLADDTGSEDDSSTHDSLSQFPKYLTGRRVFEYELRSPHFRRHVLVQYLILLQYLLTFTAAQRKRRAEAEPLRNRQLVVAAAEWELTEEEEQWVRSTWRNVVGLLEDTAATATASAQAASSSTSSKAVLSHDAGAGRAFRASVLQTLRREARWVQWKSDNCPAIDRKPLTAAASASEEEGSQPLRARLEAAKERLGLTPARRRRPKLTWSVGTPALSELWENGLEPTVPQTYKRRRENSEGIEVEVEEHTDGLEQLEVPPGIPSLRSYAQRVKREDQLAAMRKEKVDEERKTSLQWRGLRVARGDSLRLWGKIGGGEVEMLLAAEKQEEEEEEAKQRQVAVSAAAAAAAAEEKGGAAAGDETIKPDDVKSEATPSQAAAAAAAAEKEDEHDADATFMTAVDDGADEREGDAETDVAVTATPTTPPVDVDVDVPSSDLDAPAATSLSESGAIKSDDREPGEEGENTGDGDVEMTS